VVAALDGVHSTRLFASGRSDVVGAVFVNPIPVGFPALYEAVTSDTGHPPWVDLDPAVGSTLEGFGDAPITVISQDSLDSFLNPAFVRFAGDAGARTLDNAWHVGLQGYASLSSRSEIITSSSAFDMTVWQEPELVAAQIARVVAEKR
jgi:hypothetical protein